MIKLFEECEKRARAIEATPRSQKYANTALGKVFSSKEFQEARSGGERIASSEQKGAAQKKRKGVENGAGEARGSSHKKAKTTAPVGAGGASRGESKTSSDDESQNP